MLGRIRKRRRRGEHGADMDVDVEQVGSCNGVPLFRLWIMAGASAGQTVVDGLALIPFCLWLQRRIGERHWPTGVELAGLNDAGLPRITRIVIPSRVAAERIYAAASRAALQTAYALLIAGGDEHVPDEDPAEEDPEDED